MIELYRTPPTTSALAAPPRTPVPRPAPPAQLAQPFAPVQVPSFPVKPLLVALFGIVGSIGLLYWIWRPALAGLRLPDSGPQPEEDSEEKPGILHRRRRVSASQRRRVRPRTVRE